MLAAIGMVTALVFAPATGASAGSGVVAEPRQYRAQRTVDTIVIDGKANEKTWARADRDDRFSERQPNVGQDPPVRTELRVAYDDSNLYFFIDCHAPKGDVIARTLRRDNGGIFQDDTAILKIDAAHNHRDAFSLGVNPEGAQIDSLGLNDGQQFITEWDAVWFAETTRHENGWSAEFQIPFAILGLKSGDHPTLGLNITRDHPSRNATYDWALIVPPRSPMAASQFGDLVGIERIKAQRAIEFTPYALTRTNFRPGFTMDPRRRPNIATGGDVRVQVGASSYVEGSLLTDFAQVEADQVQVARDRFPLFFPERRPFFINGLDVFQFGRQREAQLFFSRRVGLVDGQSIPVLGGAKVYGRSGRVQYGALEVQTLGTPADPPRGIDASKPENVAVGRIKVQATEAFNIGAMVLGRRRLFTEHEDDAAAGIDARVVALGGKLQYYGFIAGSLAQTPEVLPSFDASDPSVLDPGNPEATDLGGSAYSFLQYRGLYVRPSLLWLWSDRRFAPRLGFYRRPGSSRQEATIAFVPRPRILGLREVSFGPRYSVEFDPGYRDRLGQSGGGNTNITWNNGASVSYDWGHFVDEVAQDFELYSHTVVARRYTGFTQAIRVQSPQRRALTGNVRYEFVELFGGRAHQPSANITARLGKHFAIGGGYTHLVGHLAQRDETFNFGFANANLDVALTRNLALDNLGRLDLSPGNERVGLQSRIRWRFIPGSDLFVVYRADFPLADALPGEPPREPFHEFTLKLTYYLRALLDAHGQDHALLVRDEEGMQMVCECEEMREAPAE
ncbi:MAG: DUF5916 domain-containing protein, partial [Myxococcota bacterium]